MKGDKTAEVRLGWSEAVVVGWINLKVAAEGDLSGATWCIHRHRGRTHYNIYVC